MDFVFCYLSEHLIGGFSLGVALRLLLHQLPHILHLKTKSCITDMALTVAAFSTKFSLKPQQHQKHQEHQEPLHPTPTYRQCVFWATYRKFYGNNQLNNNKTFLTPALSHRDDTAMRQMSMTEREAVEANIAKFQTQSLQVGYFFTKK